MGICAFNSKLLQSQQVNRQPRNIQTHHKPGRQGVHGSDLNVGKTKEIVMDFHRCAHSPSTPMNIQGRDIVPGSSSEQNIGLDRLYLLRSWAILRCGGHSHKPTTKSCLQPSSKICLLEHQHYGSRWETTGQAGPGLGDPMCHDEQGPPLPLRAPSVTDSFTPRVWRRCIIGPSFLLQ